MVKLSMHISRLLFAGIVTLAAGPAGAQSAAGYPNKPVRVILPFAAGGSTSLVMRLLADKFNKDLGQNFLLDNRPGGDSAIGTAAAAKSAPDGYTLLLVSSTYVVNHWLTQDVSFDSIRDLTPVAMLTRGDLALIVHTSFPANDLKGFISYAKANPDRINMSYSGSLGVLAYQMLMNAAGIKLTPVNYKSGTQVITDVVSGSVEGTLTGVPLISVFVKSGKAKGLAVSGARRNAAIPDVQTFEEAGLRDFEAYNWFALLAPSKTPRDIIEKLNAQVRRAQEAPEIVGGLTALGLDPYPMTVAETEGFMRAEVDRIGRLIKQAGLKPGDNN